MCEYELNGIMINIVTAHKDQSESVPGQTPYRSFYVIAELDNKIQYIHKIHYDRHNCEIIQNEIESAIKAGQIILEFLDDEYHTLLFTYNNTKRLEMGLDRCRRRCNLGYKSCLGDSRCDGAGNLDRSLTLKQRIIDNARRVEASNMNRRMKNLKKALGNIQDIISNMSEYN